ncbi:hypothetical protein BDF21DRAFT_462647 [Thamnidium elegans]|nr:hypothetical protein BDF21DRAFT_462647 [Thamnidium elegans]
MNHQFTKAKKRLIEGLNEMCQKHKVAVEPVITSIESSSSSLSSSSSSAAQGLIHTPENENKNWAYIDSVRKHYDNKIDLEA